MNIPAFQEAFDRLFPATELARVSAELEDSFIRSHYDPCPDIIGMSSVKKQKLLTLAAAHLGPGDECYFEVGAYQGKTLLTVMRSWPGLPAYACDNFSEFGGSRAVLDANLARYGLTHCAKVLDGDFRAFMSPAFVGHPVGVYFYDGAHDYESQFQGIVLAEILLAREALVIVDDWRFAPDSQSHAARATRDAISASKRRWELLYELPARFNGDHAMWWNGVGVFASYAP